MGTPPDELRDRLVDNLAAAGHLRTPSVEAALRTVPRHLFVPVVAVEAAYADDSVTTKPGPTGRPLSCASQPTIVAMMLEQLDARPGHNVLEIGAGTGYNAALLAAIVGPKGHVTTIDIYPDVTAGARHALDTAGYADVKVITGDGAHGHPERAPYDRIIVTVGPWDVPPAWNDQLAPDGRLVVPLAWRGQARSIAFVPHGDQLEADDIQLCGFIPMVGQDGEHTAGIDTDGHVTLTWDRDQSIDPARLDPALAGPAVSEWSGVTVGPEEPFDGIWLRLTGTEPGTCRITADQHAVDTGLCRPAIPSRNPAIVDEASVAYLTLRLANPTSGHRRWELGVAAHGPAGADLVQRLLTQVRRWDRNRTAIPRVFAHPAHTDAPPSEGLAIRKAHTVLIVTP